MQVSATDEVAPRSSGSASSCEGKMGSIAVVIPVYNALRYLPQTVPALLAAAYRSGVGEVIFVDNGSTDGSYEYLAPIVSDRVQVYRLPNATISAVRNYGASCSTGEYLSFLDADCLIPEDYFEKPIAVLQATGAAATGCQYDLPVQAHWIERVWHQLHYTGASKYTHYLNGGNFFVTRSAFDDVNGFDVELLTGEDAEIGKRLLASGHRIYESVDVPAVHLGNPKSLRHHYRRLVWHSLGMFGTVGWQQLDKPTVMMFAHLALTIFGFFLLLSAPVIGWAAGVSALIALQLVVPAATVVFRAMQVRRVPPVLTALFLYWLYYWARLQGVALIITGRDLSYRK